MGMSLLLKIRYTVVEEARAARWSAGFDLVVLKRMRWQAEVPGS